MRSVRGPNLAGVGGVGFRHRRRCDQRQDDPCHPPGPESQGVPTVGEVHGVVRLNLKRLRTSVIAWSMRWCLHRSYPTMSMSMSMSWCSSCAGRAKAAASPFNIANSRVGKASWYVPRPRPRRSPVAPSLVHPGDPSCGVMTGHPALAACCCEDSRAQNNPAVTASVPGDAGADRSHSVEMTYESAMRLPLVVAPREPGTTGKLHPL